jgi:colanic acid biosynthesis glycosyl transferase WcaI
VRVLILSINYSPEQTGFAKHVALLAEHCAARGDRVTVVTGFPFAPHWRRRPEYRGRFWTTECGGGVEVIRLTHFVPRRPGAMAERLLMEASFCFVAALRLALRAQRPDVVVYVGAQPAIAMLARVYGAMCRVPYVVAINDLAAQAAADVRIVRARWLQALLTAFEFSAYRGASRAIVLCPAFANALTARGYSSARIHLIPSPTNVVRIGPQADGGPRFRERHGLASDDFVILYAGSMGRKQGLANVIRTGAMLQTHRSIRLVLVGEGETRREIEQLVQRGRLHDVVRLLPFEPEAEIGNMLAAADVLLLNQLHDVKHTVIPSKLLMYMAAGRPILAAVNHDSEGAALLKETEGGLLVEPENPASLGAGALSLFQESAQRLAAMGARNRRYAEQHFDERFVIGRQASVIVDAATGSKTTSAAVQAP